MRRRKVDSWKLKDFGIKELQYEAFPGGSRRSVKAGYERRNKSETKRSSRGASRSPGAFLLSTRMSTQKEVERAKKSDPGASRHGNFMNYYQFHPAEERVRQLPGGVWRSSCSNRKYVGLDVGCNAGDLTLLLYDFLREQGHSEVFLLGIDLDPILVERAKERSAERSEIAFECLDIFSKNKDQVLGEFLKRLGRTSFDVAFCFSITMWIHLNHGDQGLREFFKEICKHCDMVVVEPQSWKCYRNASRRLRRSKGEDFPLLSSIKYREDVEDYIVDVLRNSCGFEEVVTTEDNNWRRKLLIYSKKNQV
ncbi:probable RNA methyltransferase CG11342 isoform X2 [Orussus abietinus]|uniref:probable RNA methyltransferase CG11342 isoform X2 n=1 Tax=Orussus abietinus TaxID=222816 RepID=UPI0006266645|nr:probable RNA methyltransferase CG11342 isoform X2 [Orussus abietinus]